MTTTTITRKQAWGLVEKAHAEIKALLARRQRRIDIEFEGYDPGGEDTPEETARERIDAELVTTLKDNGWLYFGSYDELWSREDTIKNREKWNNAVRAWMAAHPNQQIPSSEVRKMEKDTGVRGTQLLKPAIAHFGL